MYVCITKCRAVLVASVCHSAILLPFLINLDGTFQSLTVDSITVEIGNSLKSLFGLENFNSAVAFLLLNGTAS